LAATGRPVVEKRGIDIVLVEDDARLADVLRRALVDDGATVHWFVDGEAAVQRCRVQPPHLVLLDLELPGLSGFETARLLRENALTSRVPILVSSGHRSLQPHRGLRGRRRLRAAQALRAARVARGGGQPRVARPRAAGPRGRLGCSRRTRIVDLRCLDARPHGRCARMARLGRRAGAGRARPAGPRTLRLPARHSKVGVPHEILNKAGKLTPRSAERSCSSF
jgi:CheY-like chemotaxis protein